MMMRLLLISLAVFCFVEQLSAQISLPPVVVQSVHGNRVFLEINPGNLQVTLDSITSSLSSENFKWSNVLTNGASPGMDVNFFGYDALGLGQVTTTGTFTGDSLVLVKDATIAGRLSVTDVSSFGDSLIVAGFVSVGDSLEVVRAVSIGDALYVTGVTSLGDSLHVAGNVNLSQLVNVVGAANFGSTIDVSGETTLNDTLHVNAVALLKDSLHVVGGADFDASVNMDGNASVGGTLGVTDATSLSSTLAVTGVTSLNDSLHVADNADIDGTFNADGATVLGSTLTVSGITTLNDSLHVTGGADFDGAVSVSGILSASDLRHSSEVDIRVPDIGVTHFPWLWLHNDEGASRVYSQSDLWEVKAAEQIYIDLDGDNYLGMYEDGKGLDFRWINQPGMATSHDLVDLKSNSGMTLRAGTGAKDVGIEMTNLNDIMVIYADTLFQPISEAMMIQIDSDESTDFHPVFGGQDHLYMTDDLSGNWSLFQHLTTYDELFDTGNAVSLFGSNDVLITADYAAGIEMSDHYRTAVIYGDSLSLKGDTRVHDDLRVDGSLVVNGQDLLAIIADLETRLAALEPQPWSCGSPVEDVDGNSYATVQIGGQCWLADNLRVHHYQNGDAVDYVTDNNTWLNASAGAYCYYDNDAATNSEHGVLYNWYAATDARGLCPSGWHLPSEAEVLALSSGLGSGTEVGLALKSSASDTPPWDGENTSGFSSVPSGYRESFMSVYFTGSGLNNYLWTSTSVNSYDAQVMRIQSNNYTNTVAVFRTTGASVRCLLD